MGNFRELVVWKDAKALAVEVYALSRRLPPDERFGLISQLRRAAVSVSTNIAEGTGRGGDKELIRFLQIARGSSREVESLLEVAVGLGYLDSSQAGAIQAAADGVSRKLTVLMRSLGS
jgi:four helix bundle protein